MALFNNMFYGFKFIFKKEIIHIKREFNSYTFQLIFVAIQMFVIVYALNLNVTQVRTLVYDLSKSQESKQLIQHFVNSDDFQIVRMCYSDDDAYNAILSDEVNVVIKIPADYNQKLLDGNSAQILLLTDGTNASTTNKVLSTASIIVSQESLKLLNTANSNSNTPIELRSTVIFNPESHSPTFLTPGYIALVIQTMVITFACFPIVRERESGALEQLYLTPARPLAVILGKVLPYGIFAFFLQFELLVLACFLIKVPFNGSYLLLLLFSLPFVLTCMGIGMLISVKASTVREATQMTMILQLPSIFLSGYISDLAGLPPFLKLLSYFVPMTYYVQIIRGIMVRGAKFEHLWPQALILLICGVVLITYSAWLFYKQASRAR